MFQPTSKDRSLIARLNACIQHDATYVFQPSAAIYIPQRGAGFTRYDDQYPVLATDFLFNCIAIACYNPARHEACLLHVDAGCVEAFSDIAAMIASFGAPDETLAIHLRGGDANWIIPMVTLVAEIDALPNANIVSADLFTRRTVKEAMGKRLAIDSATGNISTSFNCDRIAGVATGLLPDDVITVVYGTQTMH